MSGAEPKVDLAAAADTSTRVDYSELARIAGIVLKNLGVFALLMATLPLNLLLVGLATLISLGRSRRAAVAQDSRRTVLISGGKMTKALQLARSFSSAGHRVILCETSKYWLTGHRFSNAVDKFCIVPEPGSPHYASSLLEIVKREEVDLYVPVCSPVSSYFDSQAIKTLDGHCEVMHPRPEQIVTLDNKYEFARAAQSLGLKAPKSVLVTSHRQVLDFDFTGETRQYVLKSIPYDSVRRLDLTRLPLPTSQQTAAFVSSLPISSDRPWVMQEFIPGEEYCTHSTIKNGRISLHCCCKSSPFQVNYEHVEDAEIEAWVRRFAEGLSLTGQASFDFIRAADDGELYAIECNPRTHSAITAFHDHPGVADAYLYAGDVDETLVPRPSSRPTYWIYHELWRLVQSVRSPGRAMERLKVIWSGKEAVFRWDDPLPFLMLHNFQIPLLLLEDLRNLRGWVRIDFNIGKLVQLGGD